MRASLPLLPDEFTADVLVLGAGVVGLAVALEVRGRGATVAVLERAEEPLRGASWAAAGMLAAEDPTHPALLRELARYSAELYPEFLERIAAASGMAVPVQTTVARQMVAAGAAGTELLRLAEWSVDPRQMGAALLGAARAAGVRVVCGVAAAGGASVVEERGGVRVRAGETEWAAEAVVHATGAWAGEAAVGGVRLPVRPRKGQMLRVRMGGAFEVGEVYRAGHLYVVPRTAGPQAGTALVGATVEDAGFDVGTDSGALEELRQAAAAIDTALRGLSEAEEVERWAGLRPGTPDELPLLGPVPGSERQWVVAGHFRNGILLAPGSGAVMADLLEGKKAAVETGVFGLGRFGEFAL